MMPPIHTDQTTFKLDQYLRDNNNFENDAVSTMNHQIVSSWEPRFKEAIVQDLTTKFKGIAVDVISSEFDLSSESSQGACVFLHQAVIIDTEILEFLKVFIQTLVNHHKTVIYPDSAYANTKTWPGKSKSLKTIFDKLKAADKQAGYFNPITLNALVTG